MALHIESYAPTQHRKLGQSGRGRWGHDPPDWVLPPIAIELEPISTEPRMWIRPDSK
ncbi:hypothetical protein EVAR_100670_1, partial [Eumeta japonica]